MTTADRAADQHTQSKSTATQTAENKPLTIVVVGGVAGGAGAATRARRLNENARIILFEKDGYVSFANCGLPYYIGEEIVERQKLLVATPQFLHDRFNIDVRVHHEVLSIDRDASAVTVRNRENDREFTQPYDKLILAPGASPIMPPIEGLDAHGVYTLRNVEDTDRIKHAVESMQQANGGEHALAASPPPPSFHAVVVGAGYIGLEMVEQLERIGAAVSLVELQPQVLPLLDHEMAHLLEDELASRGVDLHLGDGIAGLDVEDDRVTAVRLASGATLPADIVILGIGVRPNNSLAKDAGLELGAGGGIAVNESLQTSDRNIYAVGDAAEYIYGPTGKPMRVPLAGPANRAGRLAGEHAAVGRITTANAPVWGTSIVRAFGLTSAMTGLTRAAAKRFDIQADSVVIRAGHHVGYYPGAEPMWLKLVYSPTDGRVLGAQAVGGEGVDKRIDVIATAMHMGATVRDLASLDLAYAPPFGAAKDPVHMAAFAACNALDGVVRFAQPDDDLTGVQVVDVRDPAEVQDSPFPSPAVHIPLDDLRSRLAELDPDKPTVVSCASGQRSYFGARILMQHGFKDVRDLAGGSMLRPHAIARSTAPVG